VCCWKVFEQRGQEGKPCILHTYLCITTFRQPNRNPWESEYKVPYVWSWQTVVVGVCCVTLFGGGGGGRYLLCFLVCPVKNHTHGRPVRSFSESEMFNSHTHLETTPWRNLTCWLATFLGTRTKAQRRASIINSSPTRLSHTEVSIYIWLC
jgi:hypothetical protein